MSESTTGWMKLYHPRGVLCTLPLPANIDDAFKAVHDAFQTGWLLTAPGLEEGEQKEAIGAVCRREKQGRGGMADVIDCYPVDEGMCYKKITVYLNTDDERAAFESASGLKLEKLNIYPAAQAPKRGESQSSDRFIYRSSKPFEVVFKPNPRFDQAAKEAAAKAVPPKPYIIPQLKFIRWGNQAATSTTDQGEPTTESKNVPRPDKNDFSKMLSRKGITWGQALEMIDGNHGTKYVNGKSGFEAVEPWILADFLKWMTSQDDAKKPANGKPETRKTGWSVRDNMQPGEKMTTVQSQMEESIMNRLLEVERGDAEKWDATVAQYEQIKGQLTEAQRGRMEAEQGKLFNWHFN